MKPRFLTVLAVMATLGFGTWVLQTPHTLREILLASAAWVLGFWVAAGINGSARNEPGDPDEEWDEDEDWEDEEEEWDGDED